MVMLVPSVHNFRCDSLPGNGCLGGGGGGVWGWCPLQSLNISSFASVNAAVCFSLTATRFKRRVTATQRRRGTGTKGRRLNDGLYPEMKTYYNVLCTLLSVTVYREGSQLIMLLLLPMNNVCQEPSLPAA